MRTTALSAGQSMPSSRSAILDAFETALAHWSRRKTEMALAELDDHVLRDIGVDPRDVRRPGSAMRDWVVDGRSGPARLVFIGR